MKLTLNVLEKNTRDADQHWPNYMFGGRVRTSTLVLIIAFFATWWAYDTYRPAPTPSAHPAGRAPGLRSRPRLYLGSAHQGSSAAHVRHAHADHNTAAAHDHRAPDDNAASAVPAAGPAAAVRSGYDDACPRSTPRGPAPAAAPTAFPGVARMIALLLVSASRRRYHSDARLHWRPVMITLDRVTKHYKTSARPALDNVNVKIDKGEFVFLIGPSGSGKSTFMRLLLGAETPSNGDVRVSKFHVNTLPGRHIPKLRQVIGCVFQDFRLLQQKTVFENVAFALEVIGKRPDVINRVTPDVLEMVGLSGKASRLPHELSGGEQQRVAIARAFVNRPLVLLADEPTGNLDPETSNDIMDLLERINRTGTTVLMATHDHHIVDSMRQRVVELSLGRLVRDEQRGVYGMDR